MNNLKVKVFVYGTLKPGEFNYQRYCAGKVVEEIKAIAFGQLYNLSCGYPGMTLGEGKVQGYLLTFNDPAILSCLDELEDYKPNRMPEANEYNRQLIEVYDQSAQSLGFVWAYLMSSERVEQLQGIFLASGCWSSGVL